MFIDKSTFLKFCHMNTTIIIIIIRYLYSASSHVAAQLRNGAANAIANHNSNPN